MLVSRFYGFGVLGAIAQKTIVESLMAKERQIQLMNPVDMIFNVFGAVFDRQNRNDPLNPANVKWMDHLLPYLAFGTAFTLPGISLLIGCGHVFCKYKINNFRMGEIDIKAARMDPNQKKPYLDMIFIVKLCLTSLSVLALIAPIFAEQAQKVK